MSATWFTVLLSVFTLMMTIKQANDKKKEKNNNLNSYKPLTSSEKGEIYHLVIEGERNKAIKRYRALSGADLKSAYDMIKQVESNGMKTFDVFNADVMSKISEADRSQMLAYIDKGESILAIKLYRKLTNEGLAEAKKYIDMLAKEGR